MALLRFISLIVAFGFSTPSAFGDSFYIDKDGKRYLCELASDGTCWEKCPYSFSTCAENCGGGKECWSKCPYSFSSCAGYCGAGDGCWDKCSYSFSSCAESCGGGNKCWEKCPYSFSTCAETCGNKNIDDNLILKFVAGQEDRLEAERRDGLR